jgi:hypothetical protein
MRPTALLMAIVAGYAAAVLFFFARKLDAWPRTHVFNRAPVPPDQRTNSILCK